MKRILSALLALILLLSLCACNSNENGNGGNADSNNADVYKGNLINGGKTEMTVGETEATIKIVKSYKQGGLEHTYSVNITAPFTKDGDNLIFDFNKPETKTLARFTLTGDSVAKSQYLSTLAGLSYNRDPLWDEFCNGEEVSITTEGAIWGGIGLPRELTLKLNADKTFDQVYE